ncbi:MAG: UbiA prenyltransferase family protein [Archaeoglobaceae archaeon]|nr:UbiA prenyltransferase family protein [Archaeoglobaceae archaeon]MDW8117524.1 UbiA prenyltransferase family protein [Archaeoglobaceae archaeon]
MSSAIIRLLRPYAWACFLLPFSAGIWVGGKIELDHLLFGILSFSFWMSFSFVVNAIYDREVDKLHDGRTKDLDLSKQPLVTGEISVRTAWIIAIASLIASQFFAYLINMQFFYAMLVANAIGYFYSAWPRFKAYPLTDVICNALAAVLVFYAGVSACNTEQPLIVYISAFLLASTFYIPTAVSDYEFDKKAGLKNTPIFFGPERVLRSLYPLGILTSIFWFFVLIQATSFELKTLSALVIPYTLVFVVLVNKRWDGVALRVTPNLILVPFSLISIFFLFFVSLKSIVF